jgi:hypothetical protein
MSLAAGAAFLAIYAFSLFTDPSTCTTDHGYHFVHHRDLGGLKPNPGESILVNVNLWVGDSLISSTRRDLGGPREFVLFKADKLPANVPALYDAALLMGEGDSASVYQPLDQRLLPTLPEHLRHVDQLRYDIVLLDVILPHERVHTQPYSSNVP